MAEQMPPIRQLVMVQQQYIMYNKEPADRPSRTPPHPTNIHLPPNPRLPSSIQPVAALPSSRGSSEPE